MKALRPVASKLGLRSSTARRSKALRKRNATAQAVEGNLGGFDVAQKPLCSILNTFFGTRRWLPHFSQGSQAGKHSGQPELFYASSSDVAQVRQDNV
jgi:hypothetical protein